jgi:hypothetical protein
MDPSPKPSFSERMSAIGDSLDSAGKRTSRVGWGLTLALTVPILGFLLFSWIGLIVGLVVALAFAGSAFQKS